MGTRIRSHLTYANVTATLALFVALGGSSYAALKLTGRDVKDNSLTGRDVRELTTKDVKDGSLRARDFVPGELPGPTRVVARLGPTIIGEEPGNTTGPYRVPSSVSCADGERAVGGGFTLGDYQPGSQDQIPTVTKSYPIAAGSLTQGLSDPTGWQTEVVYREPPPQGSALPWVVCISP